MRQWHRTGVWGACVGFKGRAWWSTAIAIIVGLVFIPMIVFGEHMNKVRPVVPNGVKHGGAVVTLSRDLHPNIRARVQQQSSYLLPAPTHNAPPAVPQSVQSVQSREGVLCASSAQSVPRQPVCTTRLKACGYWDKTSPVVTERNHERRQLGIVVAARAHVPLVLAVQQQLHRGRVPVRYRRQQRVLPKEAVPVSTITNNKRPWRRGGASDATWLRHGGGVLGAHREVLLVDTVVSRFAVLVLVL